MNLNDYRGEGGKLLNKKAKKDGIYEALQKLYPWCKSFSDMVYYYDNNLLEPIKCKFSGCDNNVNSHKHEFCSKSCSSKHQIEQGNNAFKNNSFIRSAPWNKGKKIDPLNHVKHKDPEKWELAKKKIGDSNSGSKNGMYGKKWTAKELEKQNATRMESIRTGKFTPKSNNRHTHFECEVNGIKFRSSWEAAFYTTQHRNEI